MCLGRAPKDHSAEIAAQQERERQARVMAGTKRIGEIFGGFDDNYYNGLETSYKDYYLPQVDEQYADALKQVKFNPSGGSTSSSSYANTLAKLEQERQRAINQIGSQASANAQKYRGDVENARQSLIGQLNGGSSVESVAGLASNQAKVLSATPVYSPLADVFGKFMNAGANVIQADAAQGKNSTIPLLFGGNRGAGSYTIVN